MLVREGKKKPSIKIRNENINETIINPMAVGSFKILKLIYAKPADRTMRIEKR